VFSLPIMQKSPEWVRVTYRPLHSLRTSLGKQNLLGQYWTWWNERLVLRPLRERTQEFQERVSESRRKSEQLRLESQRIRERALESQRKSEELRRKSEERMLELQHMREHPKDGRNEA
jgi:hypothetical protein